MKVRSVILAVGLVAGGGVQGVALGAEEGRVLPTLLIKGEVVSVDANDPSAVLLKVKDRYGFETPIYLEQGTTITQGDAPVDAASLAAGTAVEVEYNFDVNTAKRHAVSVKLPAVEPPATAASVPAAAADAALGTATFPFPLGDQPATPAPAADSAATPSSTQPAAPVASPDSPAASVPASPAPEAAAPATAPTTTQ